MRWFVEVSRVGDSAPTERYCVDAKAWQAALQETRKLRGDGGPLSKFSIELLDDGYRAVDPVQKIRYLVSQAPADAPLMMTPPNGAVLPASKPAAAATPVEAAVAAATPAVSAVASPAPSVVRSAGSLSLSSQSAPLVTSVLAATPAIPRPMIARTPAAAPPPINDAVVVPTLTDAGRERLQVVPPVAVAPPAVVPVVSAPPEQLRTPVPVVAADIWGDESEPSLPVASALAATPEPPSGWKLLRKRAEDPTPQAPITYREEAYRVAPGMDRHGVESLLRERFSAVKAELASSPPGQLVQLAVFDHEFTDKPQRPPLGTLAWKDWRGEPVFGFPAFGEATPPLNSRLPPAPQAAPSDAQAPAPHSNGSVAPEAALAAETSGATPIVLSEAVPSNGAGRVVDAALLNTQPLTVPSVPAAQARASRPRSVVVRRRIGEDLIGELFELMHELHFARDIAQGSDFVLNVLEEIIPSEISLIHVFDINTRNFVVVRARGPGTEKVMMRATPDSDSQIVELMRRDRALAHRPNGQSEHGCWGLLGNGVSEVLSGAVRQGGRYLGLVELANPLGGTPFHESEINAFDYICAQFADFVASRPIVLEADVILGR